MRNFEFPMRRECFAPEKFVFSTGKPSLPAKNLEFHAEIEVPGWEIQFPSLEKQESALENADSAVKQ